MRGTDRCGGRPDAADPCPIDRRHGPRDAGGAGTRINAEHHGVTAALRSALAHARQAGIALIAAKAQVEHGAWLPWLAAHCPDLSARTAQLYMAIADGWPILAQDPQRVADLSLREAARLLAAARKPDAPPAAVPLSALLDVVEAVRARPDVRSEAAAIDQLEADWRARRAALDRRIYREVAAQFPAGDLDAAAVTAIDGTEAQRRAAYAAAAPAADVRFFFVHAMLGADLRRDAEALALRWRAEAVDRATFYSEYVALQDRWRREANERDGHGPLAAGPCGCDLCRAARLERIGVSMMRAG
jgi:hypothetical protein